VARKRGGKGIPYEEAKDRIGNWVESRYRSYWFGEKPDDAENWVAISHGIGRHHHETVSQECQAEADLAWIEKNIIDAYPDDVTSDVNSSFAIRALRKAPPEEVPEGEEPHLETTDAWDTWLIIEHEIEEYQSLDQDAEDKCTDEVVWETTTDNIEYTVRRMDDFEPLDDLPEEWAVEVANYINDKLYDYFGRTNEAGEGIDPSEEHVIKAMLILGYLKRFRDYFAEDVG